MWFNLAPGGKLHTALKPVINTFTPGLADTSGIPQTRVGDTYIPPHTRYQVKNFQKHTLLKHFLWGLQATHHPEKKIYHSIYISQCFHFGFTSTTGRTRAHCVHKVIGFGPFRSSNVYIRLWALESNDRTTYIYVFGLQRVTTVRRIYTSLGVKVLTLDMQSHYLFINLSAIRRYKGQFNKPYKNAFQQF